MEGLVCGRYRIIKLLGAGGMAEVWLGQHDVINQQAAIKVLQSHMSANKIVARRFLKEAQATVSIKHPGIVAIYDVGFMAYNGAERAYIVMELLDGETLTERLDREGPLPIEQAKRLIKQLVGAMGAAHRMQIFHRDLKPDNLFLIADPEVEGGERIKVLDFGLAKQAADAGSLVTSEGTVFGTPAYMAPEQCLDSGAVDGRADLYSIGCILFKMLCGRAPFVDDEPLKLLKAQMFEAPPPPRRFRPDISPELETLILHLLEKKPDDRVRDCTSLLEKLFGIDGESTPVASMGTPTLIDFDGNALAAQGVPVNSGEAPVGAPTLINPPRPGVPVAVPVEADVTDQVAMPGPVNGLATSAETSPETGLTPRPRQPMPAPAPYRALRHRASTGETSLSASSGQLQHHSQPRMHTHEPMARKRRAGLFWLLGLSVVSVGLVGAGVVMFLGKGLTGGPAASAVADAGVSTNAAAIADARIDAMKPVDADEIVEVPTVVADAAVPSLDAAPAVPALVADAAAKPPRPVLSPAQVDEKMAAAWSAWINDQYLDTYKLSRQVMYSVGNSRHPEATRFAAMAACKLGKVGRARYYFRRLAADSKSMVDRFCQGEGIEVVPAPK